jgi:hypothetical protein
LTECAPCFRFPTDATPEANSAAGNIFLVHPAAAEH